MLFCSPPGYNAPIILLSGFGLFIIGFFYFFFYIIKDKENNVILRLNVFSENTITSILIVLMMCTFFIPPVTFSEMAIDWSKISILNYIRTIIFLIGCAFVPGSSIFGLLFPNSTIHEKLKIEPFFIKLVLYPLISFTLLGSISLILDQIGLMREYYSLILFLIIIILHFIKSVKFKKDFKNKHFFNRSELKISRNTLFVLFLTIAVILISLSMRLSTKYLLTFDDYIAISSSRFIGLPDIQITDLFSIYTIYWGYIAFSLSALSGIPAINIMALDFFFVYLFIASIYLFFKAFLTDLSDKYAILATIFATMFSNLFYIYNPHGARLPFFTFDGIFNFRYKGFAVILTIVSMTLFIVSFRKSNLKDLKRFRFTEDWFILFVSAFFLIQSFMIYFLPIIPAISLIFVSMLVLANKRKQFKYYFYFSAFFIGFFIFFDLIFNFFFSNETIQLVFYFFSQFIRFKTSNTVLKFSITILSLISLLAIIPVVTICFKKLFSSCAKLNLRFKLKPKSIFEIFISSYTYLLILEILLNLIGTFRSLYYFTFILHLFYFNLGFTGILGFYLSYLCYKKNKQIFYTIILWFMCLFLVSVAPLIVNWFLYPFLNPLALSARFLSRFTYWFSRTWYYSIIPISILASIGLIKLTKFLSWKILIRERKKNINLSLKLISLSFIVVFIFSNSILAGIEIKNIIHNPLNEEEIHVIGWIAENLPHNSNMLVDGENINNFLKATTTNTAYLINEEVKSGKISDYWYNITSKMDDKCSIDYIEKLGNYDNVIEIFDNNSVGSASIDIAIASKIRNGWFEFFIKTTNTSKGFWLNSSSFRIVNGFSLSIASDSFYYFNGSSYVKIADIENDKWYQIKIDFECSNNNYSGLDINQWKISINGTEYGNYDFWNDIFFVNYIELFTSQLDSDWNVCITGLHFSWDSDFKFEYYLFKYLKVIDYLRTNNIPYLILSKEPTFYNVEAEKYIDIYGELIPFFYKYKLFEYKSLAIYYSG